MPDITVADVAWILALLPETDPSDELMKAIAESLLSRKHAERSELAEAVNVVRRVANARNLPE